MKIPENVATVIKAVLPLFVVIILFIIVGKFGFAKISDLQDQTASAKKDQTILNQKLDILKNVSSTGAASSNLAVAALPDSNPALLVLSQIQILAGADGITLSNLKSGSPAVDSVTNLSTVNISFDAAGSRDQVESFLNAVNSFAPITIVDKIKLNESVSDVTTANISVKSFWAPFPTTIPAVTQAITDLTPAEVATLQSVSALTPPAFNDVQASPGGRSDPFSQ